MSDAPFNAEAEEEVLSAMRFSRDARDRLLVDHGLTEQHFHRIGHQILFAAIVALHDHAGQGLGEISPAVLAEQARRDPRTGNNPIEDRVMAITAAPVLMGLASHVATLERLERRRRVRRAGHLLIEAADTDQLDTISTAEGLLADTPGATRDTADPDRLAAAIYGYLESTDPVAYTTGLPGLDRAMGGGLRPGDCTAIGAWTGMGKSVLCDDWLTLNARRGRKVHAYVNEMSFVDRGLRMVAREGGAPFHRLAARSLGERDLKRTFDALANLPFGITDCSTWTPEQVARDLRARRWHLAAIDVLHNFPYGKVAELDQIIAVLANAALNAGTHLILVCQLNEERAKAEVLPKPVVRDIRGSGMVKNRCASVVLLHRPQVRSETGAIETELEGLVYDAKHRHGPGGGAPVLFNPQRMAFTEIDGDGRPVATHEEAA